MTLADRLSRGDSESAKSVLRASALRNLAHEEVRNDKEDVKAAVHTALIDLLGQQLYGDQLDRAGLEKQVFEATTAVLATYCGLRIDEHGKTFTVKGKTVKEGDYIAVGSDGAATGLSTAQSFVQVCPR